MALSLATLAGLKLYTDLLVRRAEEAYPPQGDFVSVDGLRVHYVSRGEGRPVVFVHGDGGSVHDFTFSILDRAAEEYRAIAFDRPGFGYSEGLVEDQASPVAQARVLHGAIVALGLEQPVLVGHSRGGAVVLAYALTYPEEIAGVVTLAGAPYWKDERAPLYARALAFPVVGRLLANTILVPIGFGVVEAGLDAVFAPETRVPEEYLEAYAAYELRPEQLLAHGADMVDSAPYVRELMPRYDELRVPVILVHGTEDGSVDLADSRRLHAEVPNSQLVVVPGAGHELMFTRPQVVMEAIGRAFEATGEGG